MSAIRRSIPLLALCALLGACSNVAVSTGTTPTTPSSSQVANVGSTLQDEVEADASSLNATTAITPSFMKSAGPVSGISAVLAGSTGCVSPSSTTDTDGDGIYNDATFTFTNPPCSFTNRRGGTVALTGTLRIQDPTTTADLSYNSTLTNLLFAYAYPTAAKSYTVARSGTRNVSVTTGGLALASNLSITRTFAASPTATVIKAWNVAFTPSAGSTLAPGQPLPSGTLSISGTYAWSDSTGNFTLTVATPTSLFYDSTCTQPQPFSAGVLTGTGTVNGLAGFYRITWAECGIEPNVLFIPS